MSLQRSVRLGLTHFTLTRLVAHFLYTLINIRYARGLAVSDGIGGHVAPTLFRCKGMAVLAESWQGQAAKPIPRQFSWQASTSCYTWRTATQHGYSTEILTEFLAWRCACHHIMHRKRAILDTSYSMTQTSVLTHTYINSTLGHHDYSQCLRQKRKMTLIRRDADIFLLYISLS